MIPAGTGAPAPLRTWEADKGMVLGDLVDEFNSLVPLVFCDVKVVVREGEYVEPGYVAAIRQVIGRAVRADRVLGVDMEVAVVHAGCREQFLH